MHDIEKKTLRLLELEKLIVKAVVNWDIKELVDKIEEFTSIKKAIKKFLIENPVLTNIKDRKAQELIQKISSGEYLDIEERFKTAQLGELLSDELDESELEELGFDLFFSWFSHLDYVREMYEVGALILGVSKLPENLYPCIKQVRKCFVFQQYLAVCTLCRTALEISVRDICIKKGLLKKEQNKIIDIRTYQENLSSMINKVSKGDLRIKLHTLRDKMNFIIHGHRDVGIGEAKEILTETFKTIQDLYYQHEQQN
ncbi:MAG TPA: hypothetical protein VM123_14340 [archaeon]|nr:hypothetical protein [archaeon]